VIPLPGTGFRRAPVPPARGLRARLRRWWARVRGVAPPAVHVTSEKAAPGGTTRTYVLGHAAPLVVFESSGGNAPPACPWCGTPCAFVYLATWRKPRPAYTGLWGYACPACEWVEPRCEECLLALPWDTPVAPGHPVLCPRCQQAQHVPGA